MYCNHQHNHYHHHQHNDDLQYGAHHSTGGRVADEHWDATGYHLVNDSVYEYNNFHNHDYFCEHDDIENHDDFCDHDDFYDHDDFCDDDDFLWWWCKP